jgi:hypothetical protein
MFTGSSRRGGVGDVITAALFSGPKLRDGDSPSAFARRVRPEFVASWAFGDLAATHVEADPTRMLGDLVLQTRSGRGHAGVESELVHAT